MAKRRRAQRQAAVTAATRRPRRPPEPTRRQPSLRLVLIVLAVVGVAGFVGLAFISSATARGYSCDELLNAPPGASETEGFPTEPLGQTHVAVGTKIR